MKEEIKKEQESSQPDSIFKEISYKTKMDINQESEFGNPYIVKNWLNAIKISDSSDYIKRARLYNRAVYYLPGSYLLWFNFLKESRRYAKKHKIDHKVYIMVNEFHEKALVFMSKMPRIWFDYIKFLIRQKLIRKTRETFDAALKALPVTQHDQVWKKYLEWAKTLNSQSTACKIFERYVQFNLTSCEDYIEFLIANKDYERASLQLVSLLSDSEYSSSKGTSKYELWMKLCNIVSKHPEDIISISPYKILKHGIKLYADEVGSLWVSLTEFFVVQGYFDLARSVFEDALGSVTTSRDFGIIFDAYARMEEELLTLYCQDENQEDEEESEMKEVEDLVNETLIACERKDEIEHDQNKDKDKKISKADLQEWRLQTVFQRRPFMQCHSSLRQNPNNVMKWLALIKLCGKNKMQALRVYMQAASLIDPKMEEGKLDLLWIKFAKFYEKEGDLENANQVFLRATSVNFKTTEEIANIWCEWSEMHLRHNNYKSAIIILKEACSRKMPKDLKSEGIKQTYPSNSQKVWALYVDLEQNLGSFENTSAIYEHMVEIKLASPLTIINYCALLESHQQFENAFRIYERALNAFTWPHLYEIWLLYIRRIVECFGGKKLERVRDLFEKLLKDCPPEKRLLFYIIYGDVEENFGLISRALNIYDRCSSNVPQENLLDSIKISIAKTNYYFGITATRKVFEKAIERLEMPLKLELALKYTNLERKLGEVDRARAILMHISQFSNPSNKEIAEKFWKKWDQFELMHGSEDTYTDYLRIKRTIELKFNGMPSFETDPKGMNDVNMLTAT